MAGRKLTQVRAKEIGRSFDYTLEEEIQKWIAIGLCNVQNQWEIRKCTNHPIVVAAGGNGNSNNIIIVVVQSHFPAEYINPFPYRSKVNEKWQINQYVNYCSLTSMRMAFELTTPASIHHWTRYFVRRQFEYRSILYSSSTIQGFMWEDEGEKEWILENCSKFCVEPLQRKPIALQIYEYSKRNGFE